MKSFKITFAILLIFSLFLVGDFVYAQELIPNDPFFSEQWYLKNLNMENVWGQESGKNSVIIAVIDSGVDISHPDLHDNIWVNRDEILGDSLDHDNNGYIDDISRWAFL